MPLLPYWLNLSSFSVLKLATLLISIVITAYLFSLKAKSIPTIMLAVTFCGLILYNAASFLDLAESVYWHPSIGKTVVNLLVGYQLGPSTILLALLMLAYHFRRFRDEEKREYYVVLSLFLLFTMARLILWIYDLLLREIPRSDFGFTSAYFVIFYLSAGAQFILVVLLFLRRGVRLTPGQGRSAWSRLLRPSRDAQAARSFGLTLLMPILILAEYMLMTFGVLPMSVGNSIIWLNYLLFLFALLITYVNHTAEPVTFQVKLVGLTLAFVLSIVGLVAVFVGETTKTDFRGSAGLLAHRSLGFTPNDSGGYDVASGPAELDGDLGQRVRIAYGGEKVVELPFTFPFFRGAYRTLHVLHGPLVYLGDGIREKGWGGYHPQPALAPLMADLDPSRGGGIFIKSQPRQLTVTWDSLPERGYDNAITVQLVLRIDGSFDMRFGELRFRGGYSAEQLSNVVATINGAASYPGANVAFGPRLTGIHPGGADSPLRAVRFTAGEPIKGESSGVLYESFEASYQRFLHERMSVLTTILAASFFFVLLLFPLLLRANLIRPLQALYEGMRRAQQGDPAVEVPLSFHDEVGFLAIAFTRLLKSMRQINKQLVETQDVTIFALAYQAELRDKETGRHLERTAIYVRMLAEELSVLPRYHSYLTSAYTSDLVRSAPLHDIGKVGVPDSILLKTGMLTPEETAEVRRHCELGARVLQEAERKLRFQSFLAIAIQLTLCHHEKWDGHGYPKGLRGESIPLSARIMALADVYDALRAERVYKKAIPHEECCTIIRQQAGLHFDPEVVQAFLKRHSDFLRISGEFADQPK